MEIDVTEKYNIVFKKVFDPIHLITENGEEIIICMRDNGFEFKTRNLSVKHDGNEKYYNDYRVEDGIVHRVFRKQCQNHTE